MANAGGGGVARPAKNSTGGKGPRNDDGEEPTRVVDVGQWMQWQRRKRAWQRARPQPLLAELPPGLLPWLRPGLLLRLQG